MNSINVPSLHVWVFIARLVEHCSANAEATSSNPVEAPEIFAKSLKFSVLNAHITSRHISAHSSTHIGIRQHVPMVK